MTAIEAVPRWTARMLPGSSGEDHLGLASVSSDQILPTLSPTINVLTLHPRYHSFYAFLLDEFWRRDLPRSRRAWVRFFRPRDFVYSLAMHLCDRPEHDLAHGVTGSRKTAGLAQREMEAFDPSFDYIQEPLGGFGLYYRSVLAGLGLIYPGGRGLPYPVDVPTEGGRELAAAFRSAVEHTAYYREHFGDDDAPVPREAIAEYAQSACLCQLRTDAAPDGRMLRRRFLREPEETATARRLTFRMLLELAVQTDGHAIGQDDFRRLVFFGAAHSGASYTPRPELEETYRKWRLYQAREYYAYALTGVWCHLCDWGIERGGDRHPVALAEVASHVESSLDFDRLAERLGVPGPGVAANAPFGELLAWLARTAGGAEDDYDRLCGLHSPVNEGRLHGLHGNDATARLAGGICILASLYLRFGRPERWLDPAWTAVSRKGADGRLSVDRFMRSLRSRLAARPATIGEIARWLVEDYVILQHQLIATGKLPDNTFRFEREGNRLRFHRHVNPLGFSDSRFEALATTIHELGFCTSLEATEHRLSRSGERLLEDDDVDG